MPSPTIPTRGLFILMMLFGAIGGALALFAWRAPKLKAAAPFEPRQPRDELAAQQCAAGRGGSDGVHRHALSAGAGCADGNKDLGRRRPTSPSPLRRSSSCCCSWCRSGPARLAARRSEGRVAQRWRRARRCRDRRRRGRLRGRRTACARRRRRFALARWLIAAALSISSRRRSRAQLGCRALSPPRSRMPGSA